MANPKMLDSLISQELRYATLIAAFVFLAVTAGCNTLGGDSPSQLDSPTVVETTDKHTPPPSRTKSTTTADTPSLSPQEQEYVESGRALMHVVGARFQQVHHMDAVSRKVYPNNSVKMTIRLNDGDPVYMGMMNVTQTFSVVLPVRTTPDAEEAMGNGTSGKLYRPEKIYVDIQAPNGEFLGRFRINPETAVKYRFGKFDADVFAQNVENTLELEGEWKLGTHSPSWYLNRSQLVDWVRVYKIILRNETDPSDTIYTGKFPMDSITIHPSEMRVHHEMIWDQDKMGTGFVSAQAAMHTAYWKATNQAWAMAPLRLSHYMDRPGVDDIKGHMDLGSVFWLLTRPKNNTNLNAYLNMDEGRAIDDE